MAVVEINNGDDFKILLKIKDPDGVVIPYTEVNWGVHYYTTPDNIFKVESRNGELSPNCEIVGDEVNVWVDNFYWGSTGFLKRRVFVSFADEKFPDGRADVSTKEYKMNVKII